MNDLIKKAVAKGITDQFSIGAFFNTLNPLSRLLGRDSKQYVPTWLIDAFSDSKKSSATSQQAAQMAHITAKTIGGATTVGLLTWLLRNLVQTGKPGSKINLAKKTSGDKLGKQYKKKTQQLINYDQEDQNYPEQINKKATMYNVLSAALPISASALTALSIIASTDKSMDKQVGKHLSAKKDRLKKQLDDIMLQRIYRNRGIEQQSEVTKTASITKVANPLVSRDSITGFPALQTAAGILAVALFCIAAKAGYNYANDQNISVKQYQARKKGLQTYTKNRQTQQPTYHKSLPSKLVKKLDQKLTNRAPVIPGSKAYKELDI